MNIYHYEKVNSGINTLFTVHYKHMARHILKLAITENARKKERCYCVVVMAVSVSVDSLLVAVCTP